MRGNCRSSGWSMAGFMQARLVASLAASLFRGHLARYDGRLARVFSPTLDADAVLNTERTECQIEQM